MLLKRPNRTSNIQVKSETKYSVKRNKMLFITGIQSSKQTVHIN